MIAHRSCIFLILVTLSLIISYHNHNICYGFSPIYSSGSSGSSVRNYNNVGSLKAAIDVSGLTRMVEIPAEDMATLFPSSASSSLSPTVSSTITSILGSNDANSDIQNAAILFGGIIYIIYERRPRGDARADLLEVRKSSIPSGGLGVFAKDFIAAGTSLGIYPGYIRDVNTALEIKDDDKARENAKKYMWIVDGDKVIDPTNMKGTLDLQLSYAFGLLKVNTLIARINEPSPYNDVNVNTKIIADGIEVIAERDILANEEIFIDYGLQYDRSGYDGSSSSGSSNNSNDTEDEKIRATITAKKMREEEDMMKLQPVVNDESNESKQIDQDTSMADGFIKKLSRQDKRYKTSGIISPDEGASMFTEMGAGMFASDEDKELIDSLLGKSSSSDSSSKGSNSNSRGSGKGFKKEVTLTASKMEEKEEDVMDSIRRQLLEQGIDIDKEMEEANAATSTPTPKAPDTPFIPVKAVTPSPSSRGVTQPVISMAEKEELQNRIDNLTDEQLAQVFSKMKNALSDKLKDNVVEAVSKKKLVSGKSKLAKTAPIDSSIRNKYSSELDAVENELEKMFNDPLDVWQALLSDPDKYMGDGSTTDSATNSIVDDEMQ